MITARRVHPLTTPVRKLVSIPQQDVAIISNKVLHPRQLRSLCESSSVLSNDCNSEPPIASVVDADHTP